MVSKQAQGVLDYHDATKHHYHRYARSPGYLDWENQPHPFRIYHGCETIELPRSLADPTIEYDQMFRRKDIPTSPVDIDSLSGFLALSMGLSAWKAVGNDKWALRMNPSSGNLHPSEAHLILPATHTLTAGIYHYSPVFHALEKRVAFSQEVESLLFNGDFQSGFFIGLTSIFWREAWKYGERAFRYCNHDVGHALSALSLSAALQGWRLTCLTGLSDDQTKTLLGLDPVPWDEMNREHPDVLCFVQSALGPIKQPVISEAALTALSKLDVTGTPNRLGQSYVNWEAVYQVASHATKTTTDDAVPPMDSYAPYHTVEFTKTAAEIIRRRRSAVRFDGRTVFPKDRFFSLLERTLPHTGRPPFDADLHESVIHLLFFVHRVEGLSPGLYLLCRQKKHFERLRSAMAEDFLWRSMDAHLPFYLLEEKDVMAEAIQLSCHQDIAGMSCFSLGMVSEFGPIVENTPHRYRHLFWEAGMIGQVLYLEAEAHGFRGTGIGCYFDDAVHELLGFKDNSFQSLYHFTVGMPVEDTRLSTLAPYHHIERSS